MENGLDKIIPAVVACMNEIKGIDTDLVFFNQKGVSDKSVKLAARKAMINNGLAIIPTRMDTTTTYEQNVLKSGGFVSKVDVSYTLFHVSGQYIDGIPGTGMGIDSSDKAPGKATTYALKYALLYLFLIPRGDIEDPDTNIIDQELPALTSLEYRKAKAKYTKGELTIDTLKLNRKLTKAQEEWFRSH